MMSNAEGSNDRDIIMSSLVLAGDKMTKAMEKVGYADTTIKGRSGAVGQRVREKLAQEFTKQGLTAEYLTRAIKQGVDLASKPIVIGEDIHDYPDYTARLSYLNTLLKLMDAFPSDKLEISAETYEERIMRLHSHSQASSPDDAGDDTSKADIALECTSIESLPDGKDIA